MSDLVTELCADIERLRARADRAEARLLEVERLARYAVEKLTVIGDDVNEKRFDVLFPLSKALDAVRDLVEVEDE